MAEASIDCSRVKGATRFVVDLLFSRDERTAVRIRFSLVPMLVHLSWSFFYADAAQQQAMSSSGARVMIGMNLIGLCAFYPFVRSGITRGLRDSGLVLPQILWASASTVAALALAPTLRLPLLQVLCMIQLFGFFSLRPLQLWLCGGATLALLTALCCAGVAGLVPGFDPVEDAIPILLTMLALFVITHMTVDQSRRRGVLVTQKAALLKAVSAVQELVVRDALTGLYNRGHMEALLADEEARSRATGVAFSIALLDLDHFKAINDTHGHAVGDVVLRDFADAARRALRSVDTLARWGGEEFLVLTSASAGQLPTSLQQPLERLRETLLHRNADVSAAIPRITFSAGLSTWCPGEAPHQTIARADEALYLAKKSGRNRLVAHDGQRGPSVLS